jgi:hypothetical protein
MLRFVFVDIAELASLALFMDSIAVLAQALGGV